MATVVWVILVIYHTNGEMSIKNGAYLNNSEVESDWSQMDFLLIYINIELRKGQFPLPNPAFRNTTS